MRRGTLFVFKKCILCILGQTIMPGITCCQRYHVVKSLAHLALPRSSHGALGCKPVGGKEPSAQLGETMPETTRECKRWDAGS